eukprot:6190701-Pleurochrysis_carterae.AAC.4
MASGVVNDQVMLVPHAATGAGLNREARALEQRPCLPRASTRRKGAAAARLVTAAGNEGGAVGRERERGGQAGVLAQLRDACARREVPHTNHVVRTGREELQTHADTRRRQSRPDSSQES